MKTRRRTVLLLYLVFILATPTCGSLAEVPLEDGEEQESGEESTENSSEESSDSADDSETETGSLTGRYLLAFHAYDPAVADSTNPREFLTYVAQSDDGVSWSILPGYTPYNGSVPDVIRRDNTFYVFNAGPMRRYRIDEDAWEEPIQLKILHPDGTVEPFADPSPILDENGNIVLFYLVAETSRPGSCPASVTTCTKTFRSATEVPDSDGSLFTVDSGDRVQVTITSSESAADPDIFHDGSQFVLYISLGQNVAAYSSTTLRGSYTSLGDLLVSNSGGVPSGHYDSAAGDYWTYVHQNVSGTAIIRHAVHTSLSSTIPDSDFVTVVSGSSIGLGSTYKIESPGFAVNEP